MSQESIVYFDNYKIYCGQKYVITFPREWILNELPNTGRECENCKWYGSWRGIMLGYCANCAKNYNYKRGLGFTGHGVEQIHNWENNPKSATMTYLLNIDYNNLGDIRENPEDTMENHNKKNDDEIDKIYEEMEQEAKDEMRNHYDDYNYDNYY
uniref:Uncharacterized protein n=1 Tax=viral metagenome TaxID=1070528 RepID=A0A6C0HZ78_9ZZZZ